MRKLLNLRLDEGMTPAAAAILEGMPGPRLLHHADRAGTTWFLAGSARLACYPSGDAGMRNVAVAVLRQLGFGGRAVAGVMGITGNYVATQHNRALRRPGRSQASRRGKTSPRRLSRKARPRPGPGRRAGPGRRRRAAQPACGGDAVPRLPAPDRRGGNPGGRAAARAGPAAV